MALLALCHTPCHHATRAPSFSHMPHGTARFAQMAHTPMCCPHMATLDFPSFFCTCFLLHPIYVSLEFFSRLQGVRFVFDCCMGLRPYDGEGCILADDMGHIYTHSPHMSHAILPIYQRILSFFYCRPRQNSPIDHHPLDSHVPGSNLVSFACHS